MPMNRALYPDNWEEMAEQIKAAAGWKCQECGAVHGTTVCFLKDDPLRWINVEGIDVELLSPKYGKPVLIQVGVAHLDQDPSNSDPANLRVLCRGHHLKYDAPFHAVKAAATKKRNKVETAIEAGQLDMFRGGE